MTWPWKRPHIPEIDLEESRRHLSRSKEREQLTQRVVRQVTEERIKNHLAVDMAKAMEVRRT